MLPYLCEMRIHLSDGYHYTQGHLICQALFSFFSQEFSLEKNRLFSTISRLNLNFFDDIKNVLRGKFINLITELALHRKRLSLSGNFTQFLFSQAD